MSPVNRMRNVLLATDSAGQFGYRNRNPLRRSLSNKNSHSCTFFRQKNRNPDLVVCHARRMEQVVADEMLSTSFINLCGTPRSSKESYDISRVCEKVEPSIWDWTQLVNHLVPIVRVVRVVAVVVTVIVSVVVAVAVSVAIAVLSISVVVVAIVVAVVHTATVAIAIAIAAASDVSISIAISIATTITVTISISVAAAAHNMLGIIRRIVICSRPVIVVSIVVTVIVSVVVAVAVSVSVAVLSISVVVVAIVVAVVHTTTVAIAIAVAAASDVSISIAISIANTGSVTISVPVPATALDCCDIGCCSCENWHFLLHGGLGECCLDRSS
jgi:hypothetical protein